MSIGQINLNVPNVDSDSAGGYYPLTEIMVRDNNGNPVLFPGDISTTLFSSTARTSSAASATQTNYWYRGLALFVNCTSAAATSGVQLFIQMVDGISGNTFTPFGFNSSNKIQSVGTSAYCLYPGSTDPGTWSNHVAGSLPQSWRLLYSPLDSASLTMSISAQLLK